VVALLCSCNETNCGQRAACAIRAATRTTTALGHDDMKKLTPDFFLTDPPVGTTGRTLEPERNPTVLVVWAANRFNRIASRYYQEQFGITAMDWRMLGALCREPGLPVSAASLSSGYDKGAVSRSLHSLEAQGLAEGRVQGTNNRNKLWYLTRKGRNLHDKMLAAALERQMLLLVGMKPEDVLTLNTLLQQFMNNMDALETDLD